MNKYSQTIIRAIKKLVFIDYLFIAIFLLIVLGGFLFFKRQTVYIPVTFKVADEGDLQAAALPKVNFGNSYTPKIDYAQSFIVGDTEKNEIGKPTATITNVESYSMGPTNQIIFVTANIKAVYNPRKKQYTIKSRPVTYGTSIPFIFNNVTFTGLVVNFPGFETAQEVTRGTTQVRAQLREESREFSEVSGVPPYIATAVRVGDTITNSNNEPMATVTSVDVRPATRTVITGGGAAVRSQDPELFDVFYTLELATKQVKDKIYMFDYFPVIVGEKVPLNFSSVSVYPTIVEILKP
jgi:hypothetical protein